MNTSAVRIIHADAASTTAARPTTGARTRTSAELPPEEKNRLSHRGKAARAMVERIEAMLAERR